MSSTANMDNNREKRWSLHGATALVTGGSKGIGHAIVEELATLGATVHTCARNEAELNQCLQKWQERQLPITASVCDVSSKDEREKLMERVSAMFHGKLNILVNNVGSGPIKPAMDHTAEGYSVIMSTNFESAFHLSQLAHPLFKASGSGSIVFISSIAGLIGGGQCSLYSASKGAMNQLTTNLACEWAKDNIRCNCIAPGLIKTPLARWVSSIMKTFCAVAQYKVEARVLQFTILSSWEAIMGEIYAHWALDVPQVRVKFVTLGSYKTLCPIESDADFQRMCHINHTFNKFDGHHHRGSKCICGWKLGLIDPIAI